MNRKSHLPVERLESRLLMAAHTWTGADGNGNWSDANNWSGNVAPSAAESNVTLDFPQSPLVNSLNNDIPGLTVDSMTFEDNYSMIGDAITLQGSITATGAANVTIQNQINLAADATFIADASETLLINSDISGPFGVFVDGGIIALGGNGSFLGATTVEAGCLFASSPQSFQFSSGVDVESGGALELPVSSAFSVPLTLSGNGDGSTPGVLYVLPGSQSGANNTAVWSGPVTLAGDSTIAGTTGDGVSTFDSTLQITGNIDGGASLTTNGGSVILEGQNVYTGSTAVAAGMLELSSAQAIANTSNVIVDSGASVEVDCGLTIDVPLTLSGSGYAGTPGALFAGSGFANGPTTATWSGDINLAADSTVAADGGNIPDSTLVLSGDITGSYASLTINGGVVEPLGTNSYAYGTFVNSGLLLIDNPSGAAVPDYLTIVGGTAELQSADSSIDDIEVQPGGTLQIDSGVTQQVYVLVNDGVLDGSGTLYVFDIAESSGQLNGAVSLTVDDALVAEFTGATPSTSTGTLTMQDTYAEIGADLSQMHVVLKNNSELEGNGSIGALESIGGYISNNSTLSIAGDLDLQAGATSTYYQGNGFPVYNVGGTVTAGGNLSFNPSSAPAVGTSLTIIENTGGLPVIGSFNGLPEGSILSANGGDWQISYAGGTDGDDVIETYLGLPTSVTLSTPAASADYGQAVLTANVAATGTSNGTPTGTVSFYSGATLLGTAPVDSSGVATFDATTLAIGAYTITADYSGDGVYEPSGPSNSVSQTVTTASTTLGLSSTATSLTVGGTVDLTATVSTTDTAVTPTGTVHFFDNGTQIGSEALGSNGHAVLSGVLLPLGSDPITATYSGDTIFTGSSTSAATTVTVSHASTTLALSPSATSVAAGSAVNFTATVSSSYNGAAATGTVLFFDNGTQIGSATLGSNHMASLTGVQLPAGDDPITATYSGDTTFSGSSTAAATSITVTPSLALAGQSVARPTTGTGSATFTVTLSAPSNQSVTVNYATVDGTALAGRDYTAASGTLTFAAGQTSKTVSVPVTAGSAGLPDRTFSLALSSPANATAATASVQATIQSIDAMPTSGIIADELDSTRDDLVVYATEANNLIRVRGTPTPGKVQVVINNRVVASGMNIDRVIVYGGSGNNSLSVGVHAGVGVVFFGGAGTNVATGAQGNNIFVGGSGTNAFTAGARGASILVGGSGASTLSGSAAGDILVGGALPSDTGTLKDLMTLESLLAGWTDGSSYVSRVSELAAGPQPAGVSLTSDSISFVSTDHLQGKANRDLIFAA